MIMNGAPEDHATSKERSVMISEHRRKYLQFSYWYLVVTITLAATALSSHFYYVDSKESESLVEILVQGIVSGVPFYSITLPLYPLGFFLFRKSRWQGKKSTPHK